MKKVYILLAMLALLVVTGCSNADKKEDMKEEVVTTNSKYSDLPSWVLDPTYEDALAAVGTAKIGTAGMSFARTEAMADARAQLAQSIEVKVNTMFKSYVNSVGVAGNDGVEKVATSVSKQVASQTIRGSVQKQIYISDTDDLYILVIVPNESLREETIKTVNTTLGNDQALWQEFKSEKAQQELDFAVENMLQGE